MCARTPCARAVASRALLFAATPLLLAVTSASAAEAGSATEPGPPVASDVMVTGMTFVTSRGEASELVLRAREGRFRPETNVAELAGVIATAVDGERGRNFEVRCERGELDLDSNDFLAEGDVRGLTSEGQTYTAPWVRYDHEKGLLYTDAPVVMRDATGTFRGDGFRYQVGGRRFELLGNVRVVQAP